MASEWQELSLAEAGVQLIDCDHRTPPAADSGYPYIAIPQLKDGHIDLSDVRWISAEHYADWTRKLKPRAHDVVVVRRCSSGESAVVPEGLECAIGQNLVILRSDRKKVHPEFLRWLVRGPEWWSEVQRYINVGAVFDSLKCRDIPHFRLTIPPLEEQRAIAETLGALDDRIDNLRQTNATLQAIAAALFKSRFVDFDGVLPEDMQESELGLIPKGWRVGSLGEALEINPKRELKKGTVAPYLDMASLPTTGAVPDMPVMREFSSGPKFINGDTLLARITPCLENGKTAFVDFLENDQVGWGSTEFIVLRPKLPLPPFFGYLLARRGDFREHAIRAMSGTSGRQRVEVSQLHNFIIAIPDETAARAFAEFVEPLQRALFANEVQAATIATLRDTLLPRLISGRVRAGEV